MYVGPGGASTLSNGFVAIHALNATANSGRKRRSATSAPSVLPAMYALTQALNVRESKSLFEAAVVPARLDSVLAALAWASCRRDSVLHFADANPDHAAMSATMASNAASMIVTVRSRPVGSCRLRSR